MRRDKEKYKGLSRRALLMGAAQLGCFGLLSGRMYQLQVLNADRYQLLAEENRINQRLLRPRRGLILDRNNEALAINRPLYHAELVAEQVPDLDRLLEAISRLVILGDDELIRIREEVVAKRPFVPVRVKENLDFEQVNRIEAHSLELPGIRIETGFGRLYPHGETAAHILGYVGRVNAEELAADDDPLLTQPGFEIGKTAIEKAYDSRLRGKAGRAEVEVNALGRDIRELLREPAEEGEDVQLTIDISLQAWLKGRLADEVSASAMVMDCHSGEVYAQVSSPAFDPNDFVRGFSHDDWQELINSEGAPLTNKVISGQYPPASTFKMMASLAGLELGVINEETKFHCPGYMDIGTHRFHCWKHSGHGNMSLSNALMQSCDVYFYKLISEMGINPLAEMARKFGLGASLGIEIAGEKSGLIPDENWKRENYNAPWHQGESLNAVIGQGYVLVTVLQLATMTARLSNGGKAVFPHLVKNSRDAETIENLRLDITPRYLSIVKDAMDRVVNSRHGTGYSARIEEEGMEMGGKTGTAQVLGISRADREEGNVPSERVWEERNHALFVGYAPIDNPRYATAVVVEHGGSGGASAAPIARDLLLKTQELKPEDRRV